MRKTAVTCNSGFYDGCGSTAACDLLETLQVRTSGIWIFNI